MPSQQHGFSGSSNAGLDYVGLAAVNSIGASAPASAISRHLPAGDIMRDFQCGTAEERGNQGAGNSCPLGYKSASTIDEAKWMDANLVPDLYSFEHLPDRTDEENLDASGLTLNQVVQNALFALRAMNWHAAEYWSRAARERAPDKAYPYWLSYWALSNLASHTLAAEMELDGLQRISSFPVSFRIPYQQSLAYLAAASLLGDPLASQEIVAAAVKFNDPSNPKMSIELAAQAYVLAASYLHRHAPNLNFNQKRLQPRIPY